MSIAETATHPLSNKSIPLDPRVCPVLSQIAWFSGPPLNTPLIFHVFLFVAAFCVFCRVQKATLERYHMVSRTFSEFKVQVSELASAGRARPQLSGPRGTTACCLSRVSWVRTLMMHRVRCVHASKPDDGIPGVRMEIFRETDLHSVYIITHD